MISDQLRPLPAASLSLIFLTGLTIFVAPTFALADVRKTVETCRSQRLVDFPRSTSNLRFKRQLEERVSTSAIQAALSKKTYADQLLTQAGFQLPNSISILPVNDVGTSVYLYGPMKLQFTVASATGMDWRKLFSAPDRRLTGPTFIHEYAHAFFWEHLRSIGVPWARLKAVGEIHDCSLNPGVQPSAKAELKTVIAKALTAPIHPKGLTVYSLHQIVIPYTELFSDMVEALVYDNPSIENIPITPYVDADEESHNRDFAFTRKSIGSNPSDHEWLAECRNVIYQKSMIRHMSATEKANLIRTVFQVFAQDIELKWRSGVVRENRSVQVNRVSIKLASALSR